MTTSFVRRSSVLAIAALAVALGSAVASADDISNNLDLTIDAVAEVMPLTVGGAPGATGLYVQPRGGDGKAGCNLTGSTTLTVSIASSNPAAATVSPSSVTFTSCGSTEFVTVTPVAAGSTTVSLAQTGNNTGGSFNLAPGTFQVDVSTPPNTSPTVAVTGVTPGTSYEFGSVPPAGCSVVDAEDGNSSPAPLLSAITGPLAAYGLGERMATCTYTDAGGLTATSSATYGIVDTTDPTITFDSRLPAANGAGWNNSDVALTWSCSDNVAVDNAASTTSVTLSADGANQSATGTCVDVSGNTSSNTQTGISIDKTAPTITFDSRLPTANGAGWNNSDVTLTWSCSDNIAVDNAASTTSVTLSADGADQSATGTCTDLAGNTSSNTQTGVSIDKAAPTVQWVGGPADAGSYYFGSVPAAPTCDAVDTLSGPDTCVVTGHATSVGNHTMTATALDVAGNTGTGTRGFSVLAWTLGGFYQPVDMGADVWNTVKGGSTVPLKFEVFSGATELTNVGVVDNFLVKGVTCPQTGVTTDDIELTTTGATSLRYDATGGQFIQNWQTPKKPGVCYRVTMTTDDGSSIGANFKLK